MSDITVVLEQAERAADDLSGDDPKWSSSPVDVLYGNRADSVGVGTLAEFADVHDSATATSGRPYVGTIIETGKRASRRGMSWYVQPFIGQVNQFNKAVVRSMQRLVVQMDRFEMRSRRQQDLLVARLQAIESRLAELERGEVR